MGSSFGQNKAPASNPPLTSMFGKPAGGPAPALVAPGAPGLFAA